MNNFIRKFRKNSGLSQETLAERCGATKATISKLEKGEIQLTQAWMDKIAKALGCQPWELISESVHIDTIKKETAALDFNDVGQLWKLYKTAPPEIQEEFDTLHAAYLMKKAKNPRKNGDRAA